jgi:predicted phage baseplate assembly protein
VDFDFLPNLPKSDLDDRTYKDLVEECILRIPRYCPEWTNFNPSDPGVTLIELFAWLTDQMLLRFNQVPRRNYVSFLELLGIRLQPPAPAQVDLTFYLTSELATAQLVELGTEVSTLRASDGEPVVFTTERHLVVGNPRVQHFLKSSTADLTPTALEDAFGRTWSEENGAWTCREQTSVFSDRPKPGNCFYLVFEAAEPLNGNVMAVNFKGEAATTTGINPLMPPRRWEAWNGERWVSILLEDSDDGTRGFSFNDLARQGYNLSQGAEVVLHCPQTWPSTKFMTYEGRWLRCAYVEPTDWQPGYLYSPRITGIATRSVGGTVSASHCFVIRNEMIGTSNGKPGQGFQLRERPVLARHSHEYIEVTPPGEPAQRWREVKDFSESRSENLHYIIDSLTGIVQFGPLIRESTQLKQQTEWRSREQFAVRSGENGRGGNNLTGSLNPRDQMERQYGKVPPRGSDIRMVAYRSGGGSRGNVQAHQLTIPRTSIPYIQSVTNHYAAQGGTDAESLSESVMRVPQILRTRDRAVTSEDFEILAKEAGDGKIARAHCLTPNSSRDAGKVRLLVVPRAEAFAVAAGKGLNPEKGLMLEPEMKQQLESYLDERKLLGVQVYLQEPDYTRVSVQTEVALDPQYHHASAQAEILSQIRQSLYRFLNPLTGGVNGQGWPLGIALHPSDIISICQKITGVRHLGIVRLFELRQQGNQWARFPAAGDIDPGPVGLISSWEDTVPGLGHTVTLL